MKPSDIQRARNSLRDDRRRLNEQRAALDRRALEQSKSALADARRLRALERERAELVAALRHTCSRFGDLDWSDAASLADVVNDHLVEPLEVQVAKVTARVRRLQEAVDAAPAAPVAPPVSLAPVPSNGVRHATISIYGLDRARRSGYVATCTCGWRGAAFSSSSASSMSGSDHVEQANWPTQGEPRAHERGVS